MIKSILRILPLLILAASTAFFIKDSPVLEAPLVEGIDLPLGTMLAWLCITMLPLSILLGIRYIRKPISPVYRFYNRAFLLLTLLGMAWGAISYLLAGNWTFTFANAKEFMGSEIAFELFLPYSSFVIAITLLTFIIFGIHHLTIYQKQKK